MPFGPIRSTRLRRAITVSLAASVVSVFTPTAGRTLVTPAPTLASNFQLVGHNPLFARGMNAAPALYNDDSGRTFVYVGSRTDSSSSHPHPGILVVDATVPASPTIVNEIGGPAEGKIGETSRELRVWPEQKLLMVLHFTCSSLIHACDPVADQVDGTQPNITFYDLTDPTNPQIALTYLPTATPHELFLWSDPVHPGRALLYMSMPASTTQAANLVVLDLSPVALAVPAQPVVLASWSANGDIAVEARRQDDVRLHSLGVSPDGTRAYLAYLGAGFLVLDTSPLTNPALAPPIALRLRTPTANRAHWGNPGTHSAVEVFGQRTIAGVEHRYALTTDEVYGESSTPLNAGKGRHGCPWGWMRVLDITDETAPAVVGEYKVARNETSNCVAPNATTATPAPAAPLAYLCAAIDGLDPTAPLLASYSSHNPTVLKNVAFVTWHSAGLQAVDLSDPTHPVRAGEFVPVPLPAVATEDPALSSGLSKVVMWSYPILNKQAGQTYIYVVDIRNGLYVLRYTGAGAAEVNSVSFLEGNSTVGDAAALDGFVPPTGAPPGGLSFGPPSATAFHFDSALPVGDAQRVGEFGAVDDGPRLTLGAPPGPTRVATTSRFGNPGLAGNPLLAYFTYRGPAKIDGAPTLNVWLSAPGAPGVASLPLGIELFIDGTPVYGHADATGSWIARGFVVDAGPVPQRFSIPLPPLSTTALDSLVVQLSVTSATADAQPKLATLLYGSPMHDSTLTGPVAFPI